MVKSFVIDREMWRRGPAARGSNALLNGDGTRCCLGFYAGACGVPDGCLHTGYPSGIPSDIRPQGMQWLLADRDGECVQVQCGIAADNDSPNLTEEERERRVTAHFAEQGIEVTFIN